jgi:hypothetical protein
MANTILRKCRSALISSWPTAAAGLATSAVVAVIWVHDVSGYGTRIDGNEAAIAKVKEDAGGMKKDIAVIRQRVEDIADFIGVPRKSVVNFAGTAND